MEGVNVWVDGWGGIGDRKLRQRKGEDRSAKVFAAIKCNKSNQALELTSVHML